MNRQLEKYLRSRAITLPWSLVGTDRSDFKAATVIPALAESKSLPKTIDSLALNPAELLQQTLIIVVVNNRSSASEQLKADNRATLEWLQSEPHSQLTLAWVDAASSGLELPEKEGVGLARKIGFDLALTKLDWTQNPLLISLDADTLVEQNYLNAIFEHFDQSGCGGATVPFRHQAADEPLQQAAIRQYELYLRSYLFGLQQAGSPYAYHTIGSAFVCRAEAYLAAGGMNRRHAAEDFYFLQQLAKTSGVEIITGTLVCPSARFSERVPFGTGRAVQEQVSAGQRPFQFSSASSFQVLQQWLQLAADFIEAPVATVVEEAEAISSVLAEMLAELDFASIWSQLQNNFVDPEKRLAAFHCWFDGLRTRQLLTRLDAACTQSRDELLAELLRWGGYPGRDDGVSQLQQLERLQGAEDN